MTNPDEDKEIPLDDFDGEDLDDDLEGEFDDDLDDDLDDDDEDKEEDEEVSNGSRHASTMSDDENEDKEDIDPDNVEDDLDTILKDRLAAGDDEDEDTPEPQPEAAGQVTPKRDNEWTCEGCFLIVSPGQFGPRGNPRCPSGEEPCPSLDRL